MDKEMGYVNFKKELERKKMPVEVISYFLNMEAEEIRDKLNGKDFFTIEEAVIIRQSFFPDKTIEYLFYKEKGKEELEYEQEEMEL